MKTLKKINSAPHFEWKINTSRFSEEFEKEIRNEVSDDLNIEPVYKKVLTDKGTELHIYQPFLLKKEALPAICFFHGGGLLAGNATGDSSTLIDIVKRVQCRVISVEYRLAPEFPYPTPLKDCLDGLEWIFSQPQDSIDLSKVLVMGFSAGGGLATALAQLWSDLYPEKPLLGQILIYPMLDCETGKETSANNEEWSEQGKYIWTKEMNQYAWKAYMKNLKQKNNNESNIFFNTPYFSPIKRTDLENLPSAYICVGALDLFLEENLRYASNLLKSGVNVRLEVVPGQPHSFDNMDSVEAKRFYVRLWDYINDFFNN